MNSTYNLDNCKPVPMSPVDRELQRQLETITSIHVRFEELEKLLQPILKDPIPSPVGDGPVSPPEEHCRVSNDILNRTDELRKIESGLEELTRRLGV